MVNAQHFHCMHIHTHYRPNFSEKHHFAHISKNTSFSFQLKGFVRATDVAQEMQTRLAVDVAMTALEEATVRLAALFFLLLFFQLIDAHTDACMRTHSHMPSSFLTHSQCGIVASDLPGVTARKYIAARTQFIHPFSGAAVASMELKKEFATNAKPSWLKLFDADGAPLLPDVVAKVGDDLRKDFAIGSIGKVCEALWSGRWCECSCVSFICVLSCVAL
jgi:hypothetical protein